MPSCFLARRIGAHQAEDPVGVLGVRGPGLLAVHDEVALAVVLGAELERGQIAAGVGLGVALAPDLFAGEDLRQEALLLGVGAELDEERADHEEAERARACGAPASSSSSVRMKRYVDVEPGPAVLDRPVRRDPALAGQDLVPLHDLVVLEVAVDFRLRAELGGHRRFDPGAHFVSERALLSGERQVHRSSLPERGMVVEVGEKSCPPESSTGRWRD